ncbi:type II toxin-antitoxin system HipA family toxin [Halomonas sp. TRM85114]|uniref:type II toxin-antitoxin system HipA family toxin n=1 Tax=Halomonas jincaotanensis TaxID=2810616 RepID=UPI001BD34E0B|nr:HipA domain-containing protein [Halomonas jincaotanensis]MBS9402483.1 type II toxin-antitoxin system HipA family toxin [Halomonas jincaotanensis]
MELTLQIHFDQAWHDAAILILPAPDRGIRGEAKLRYEHNYAIDWMFHDDLHACSLLLPVELMLTHSAPRWFGFLEDIMPAGASRRFWVNYLGLHELPEGRQDTLLLAKGTIAPVGNLRIKEAVPEKRATASQSKRRFSLSSVVERHTDFLEYAQQMGAASGGATGAGGEAPKLLLRLGADERVWIDTWQDEDQQPDRPMLVKFPRGRRSSDDCDILRAEYHYYQELAALGVDTIDTESMQLVEGERYPSLWLPRFAMQYRNGAWQRYGLESVYSLMEAAPGSFLKHGVTLRRLVDLLQGQYRVTEQIAFDSEAFVIEWVKRDLLNIAFGNSDNHGRNTALLKRAEGVWLSPVFDFAPMKADPEGVTRTMQWGTPLEVGGEFDWLGIADSLADLVAPERLMAALTELALALEGLGERLESRGVPTRILGMPAVGLNSLNARLQRWGLL